MPPGTYLRRERTAAGVAIEDVVVLWDLLRLRVATVATPADLVRSIEGNLSRANARELMALRLAFPFNPGTYRRLCAEADAKAASPIEGTTNGQ